jgi:hypothetical protein
MSKFEKLLDLLVNEQKDEAEKVFHEIVVEKSRQIYEGILADEEAESTDESADKDDADEVDEAMHKDKKEKVNAMAHGDKKDKKKELKAGMHKEDVGGDEDEDKEEPAESTDETIEEIGGDQTDDLISDIESEAEGMHMDMDMDKDDDDDDKGMDHDGDFDDDGDQDEETEEMFEPLEKELDQLKAEFAKMMDKDDDKPVNAMAHGESAEIDADTIVKEYAEMVKSGHGAEKMGKEAGADQKKSPVAGKNKPVNDAKAHSIGGGAEEKGGVGKALTGDTAKPMGKTYKNAGGSKSQKLDMAPKAETTEGSVDATSPVASK